MTYFLSRTARSLAASSPQKLVQSIKMFSSPQGPWVVFFISDYVICHSSGINEM